MPKKIGLKFNNLAKSTFDKIEEGIYTLQIEDVIEQPTNTGGTKFVMSHKIVGANKKIQYDNYAVMNKDGSIIQFGTAKLRALIEATKIDVGNEDLDGPLLNTLLVGKTFKAKIVMNDKNFPQINYADIYSMDYESEEEKTPTVDTEPTNGNTSFDPNNPTEEETETEVDTIDTDDI